LTREGQPILKACHRRHYTDNRDLYQLHPLSRGLINLILPNLTAKAEVLRDKILGGKAPARQLADKRVEIREVISSELLQEIILK
jgi:hypothetical protein